MGAPITPTNLNSEGDEGDEGAVARSTSSTVDFTAAQEEVTPRRSVSTVDLIIDTSLPTTVRDEGTPQVSPSTIEFTFEVPVPVAALHADDKDGFAGMLGPMDVICLEEVEIDGSDYACA